jgi:large subunit ribosomal protein L9
MPRKIPVILLEDIGSLGKAGDIISIAEGYARNFLFPQGKAALAEENAVKMVEQSKKAKAAAEQAELTAFQAQAEALDGTELILTAKRKEDEGPEIFGSLTSRHIAEALQEQAKLEVRPKDVVLQKPITELGSYDVTVKLSPDVETTIKVTVNAEES